MLENLQLLRQDKLVAPGILICLLITIFGFSFFLFNFGRLPPEAPLFYSRPWGQEQLALSWQLTILPFSALLFFLFDLVLASKLYSQQPFLSQVLIWSATVFSLLTTITLVKIITLVT